MKNDMMNKWKEEYKNIKADEAFKKRLSDTMKAEKRKLSSRHKWMGAAACLCLLTASLNASPTLAYAMSQVPVMDSVVRVLTLNRYEVKEDNYQAKIETAQIQGLMNPELEAQLNAEFKENAAQIIAAFGQTIEEMQEASGDGNFHENMEYTYSVKTDNEDILALEFTLFEARGSAWEKHTFYNIDKKAGKLIAFSDLFKEGANYTTPIDAYLLGEMERMNKEEGGMFFLESQSDAQNAFRTIGSDPKFYINADGNIVICFDEYEVAAGAQGSPSFVIPQDVVKDILK
ncbi:DUF3298 domain-containing protein [Anaerotignum lactatifermentans]|uniref:DUF3298 domain-containing protein n=1 Tax=Anaerotignum lactatifermentans TaxID=160404 RepID=A0ABS2GCM7_9FIRM|nr:DUF3298 domain-containing protein [Anaerotignum lactatifermentans]MBM6830035.1 DUF3298 domain-containing protein [Anaerotignum lactatifermentans]MBM6878627.1 DUF3298 domain-containing protein [Anaerotignum lactatifermentans]MBM6951660.1 DUF3298 domain-containing protein [Anaerotignum lactatifermentans]